jgi:hypothetical protein
MALVNPNIAMSFRAPEIQQPNMLADYAAIQQIQGGRQAQEMNALKMQEAQAALQERNALRQLNPTAADYEAQLFKVNPTLGIAYRKEQSIAKAQQAAQAKSEFDLKVSQRKFGEDLKRSLSSNPSDENIIAFGQDALIQGLYTPDQVKSTVAQLLALPAPDRVRILSQAGASASELKPTVTPQTLGGTVRLLSTPAFGGAATPVEGSVGTVTMTPAQEREAKDSAIRIKQEGQRIGLEGRRVAVLEQDAKQKQDPVFQQTMANARATGEAIAKGTVAAQQALPGVITNAMIAVNAVDDMIGRQAVKDASGKVIQPATAPHKGFQDAVGATWKPGFRFIPGTDASDFQSYQDQIEGAAFLSAFEALKGGGAISEKEGSKATAAKLRMKLAQSEVEYVKAAREFQEVVRTGVENARRKFGAGGAAPAAGGANIDALLDKYK